MKLTDTQVSFLRNWMRRVNNPHSSAFVRLWIETPGDFHRSYELTLDVKHPAVEAALIALVTATLAGEIK